MGRLLVLLGILLSFLSSATFCLAEPVSNLISENLRKQLEYSQTCPPYKVGQEPCYASNALPLFYRNRDYRPAWVTEHGIAPQADALIATIRQASLEGLNPADYHLAKIENLLSVARFLKEKGLWSDPKLVADLDFLLTDSFLIYGDHIMNGRVDPMTLKSTWFNYRKRADLPETLAVALEQNRVADTLDGLLPHYSAYHRLREGLARYRAIADNGGWPSVPAGPTLRKDMVSDRVSTLRLRLLAEGDLPPGDDTSGPLFDEKLETAVKAFQRRNGLDDDGAVGANTLEALNVTAAERVEQLAANMERWRWLPEDLGPRTILVNIADQTLAVIEQGRKALGMRVVVGQPYWSTPVFSAEMTYLVINPYWNVPPGIARKETIPKTRRDPGYLRKNDLKIISGWGEDTHVVDPSTINWHTVSYRNFPYRFRQDPGPENALGRIKFMFPNKYFVYLHDTPARNLFQKSGRAFSHGCIRVEHPLELAEYVLQGTEWNRERIEAVIEKGAEKIVRTPQPIPVRIFYWTAWVDENGVAQFRPDIYGRDEELERALRENPTKV